MRQIKGRLWFSATDLSRHLACSHLTTLRRAVAFGELEPPPPYDDPRAEVLRQRGFEHEQRVLDQFTADGRTVETIIPPDTPFSQRDPVAAAARARDAMRRGADVIYQGRLEDDGGRCSGYPDFLLRVGRPSTLGGWSYEVLDTKLARHGKGEALLQLLLYSDLLAQAQGIEAELMHLALGGGRGESRTSFRVAEYAAYYRVVRQRFEAHAASAPESYPEPVEHCGICEWQQACAERRRADDHLSLVAGITRGQRARLVEREVTTMAALVLPVAGAPAGVPPARGQVHVVGVLPPVRLHRGGARREPGHARGADLRRRGGTGEALRHPPLPLPRAAARDRGRELAEEPRHLRNPTSSSGGSAGRWSRWTETAGTIDLKRGRNSPVPHPAALVPLDNVQNKVLREGLARLAEAVVSGGFAADSPRRAAFDLLGRVPPRIRASASPPNTSDLRRPGRPRCPGGSSAGRGPADRPVARPLRFPRAETAGQRQDLHRSPDDPRPARRRQAGRGDRQQPQGHLQPAHRGVRLCRRAAGR